MNDNDWLNKADDDRNDRLTDKMIDDETKIENLLVRLAEIREVWTGSESFKAETCSEDYLNMLCEKMYTLACAGIRENQ